LKKTAERLREQENQLRSKQQSAVTATQESNDEIELENDNRILREKLAATEANVGIFVKEMGSLLDQHEPPPTNTRNTEDSRPLPTKGVKLSNSRAFKKSGASRVKGQSPDDKYSSNRRSIERKSYLHFD
jgi:hypothetical protein